MNKKNKKFRNKKLFITRLVTLTSFLVFTIAIITSLSIGPTRKSGEPEFIKYNSYYDGSNVEIVTPGSADSITTITMTRANQLGNNDSGKIITIESADELALFSTRCKSTPAFLGYSYKLISNISWSSGYFNTIGASDNKFTGIFDGQGYQIDDLTMNLADNANPGGIYYSMFNYVGTNGQVKNLGLSHPVMTVADASDYLTTGGVSYLVGENAGTVENCFVVDDGDAFSAQAGIYAAGGVARIAGLIVNNANGAIFRNCYIATSAIFNIQLESVAEYNEVCLDNSGTITNVCFYNDSIKSLNISGSKATITYKSAYKLSDQENDYFGTYKEKVEDLVAAFEEVSGWYTENDYGAYKDYTGIKYAIYRGISLSGTTFTINDEYDFAYMYELFNTDDKFASNEITYVINANLNLAMIPVTSYTYKKGIGSTIKGTSGFAGRPIMANNSPSAYPTIYNVDVMNSSRIAVSTGVDCYGLFNYLTGTVENLNVVPNTMNFSSIASSNNAKGIGALSGYIEGGTVKNVNVYLNVSNTNSNIGEYYLGGITGILGGNGKIGHATSAGTFTLNQASTTLQTTSSYMGGVAIGGVVGYIENSNGAVYNTLNSVDITSYLGASAVTYAIGGVIGAGYTMDYDKRMVDGVVVEEMNTGKLENVGTITVGSSSYHSYGELYVAGIIGRHLGELNQVSEMTNKANISVYANGNTTYVSGVENADIKSTKINNTGVEASQFVDSEGNTLFYASSLANGAEIAVTGDSTKLNYTNVINVIASSSANNFRSKLSNLYNLAYSYKYDDNGSATRSIAKLSAQNISMPLHNTFAPVLNVVGGSSQNTTKVTTAYNLRDINFNLSSAISNETTFNYAGCALGEYITFSDIKNEGNLTVNLSNGISSTSTLKVSGLFDTLSQGCTATNIYNGGDILVSEPNGSNSAKALNIYLAGICYQNLSTDSNVEQNPLNASFDSKLIGTMDSVINNGNITVSSYYLNKTTAINVAPATTPYYSSNIYVGGITYTNSGIISNAFNLGNIDVSAYSTEEKNYEAGGISCLMNGQYAQVRDSANNGDIYVIDLGGKATQINSHVNVGGIVARNTGANNSTNNSQIIAFTINYGTVIGFLARDNMTTTSYNNAHSVASGVLGTGFCNMINIVNYGNIYGKECVAGIMGIVNLGLFNANYTSTIANTLNYGQVKIIPPYDNLQQWATYNVILSLETVRSNDYSMMYTHAGSICSIFDFNNRNNVTIRYLINLYNGELTVFSSLRAPSTNPDVSTFITTKGATDSFGSDANKIPYAPLSTVEDENNNIGVFSSEFSFRRAIDGIGLDSRFITDSYIADFFQFVKFDKVNQVLLETIGWRTIAYANAAEDLVKNIEALKVLVDKAGNTATSLLSDAFVSDSWISNCNIEVLESLIEASFNSGLLDSSISTILDYILFDTTATSSYTLSIRTSIIEKILEFYAKQGDVDYYVILQSMLYDTLLAKVVSGNDANYTAVKTKIEEVLAESPNLETILNTYIAALEADDSIINGLFVGSDTTYYETAKINLVTTLLEGYDDATLESLYITLNLSPSDEDSSLKYKLYLQQHQDEAANIYSHLILNNSLVNNSDYLSWVNNNLDKYNVSSMLDSSTTTGTVNGFGNITSLTGYKYSPVTNIDEFNSTDSQLKTIRTFETANITSLNITPTKDYRNLWNIIKTDSAIQNYISTNYFTTVKNPTTDLDESGIIAKATEYTNSYQTNDRTLSDYGLTYYYDEVTNGRSFYIYDVNGAKYHGGINYGYYDSSKRITYNNNFGGLSFGDNYPMRTRFIYTPDDYVTYRTNYLGPYATTTGIVYDQQVSKSNGGVYFSGNQYGYKKGANLAATDESNTTARGTVPVFISLNSDLTTNMIAESGTNAADKSLYRYYWNNHSGGTGVDMSSDYMWKQENFVTLAPTNTTGFIYKNYNSGTYMCDYYNFDPTYVPTNNIDNNTNTTLPNGQNLKLVNATGGNHTYREYYLTAYCTAAIITGLYYTYSSWYNNGTKCVSLLAKRDGTKAWNKVSSPTDNYYCGVYTTDYICYKIDDLVKLDGYKTKGFNASIANNNDQDETNIIGAIVEKLLTDNKKLVLKAIANYSIDHDFTASDANTLNMLLTSIGDTDFAKQSIIESIPTVKNMNYSGLQTISTYLEGLNINFTNYSDRLIISTVNNKLHFKNLLLATLTNYSIKCSNYATYNIYNRNDVNNFVYKYLSYLYANDSSTTAAQIDAIFASSSDAELQKLEDLLVHIKNAIISYDDDVYAYNDVFTIYDVILYSREYVNYVTDGYNTSYNCVMVADNMSGMEFSTGNYQYGYKLEVTYKGTIDLDGNDSRTSATITTQTFTGLSKNSSYMVYFNQGTEIYDIKLKNSDYSGYETTPTLATTASSPFASVSGTRQISNTGFTQDGNDGSHTYLYGHYYANLWRRTWGGLGGATESEMYILISKGSNIDYNSINISFKTLSYYQPSDYEPYTVALYYKNDGSQATYDSYNGSINLTSTYNGSLGSSGNYLYQTTYTASLSSTILNRMETSNFYITLYIEKPVGGTNNAAFSVNDFIITYDFDFVNNAENSTESNVVFNQNLFNPYYSSTIKSSYTITNSNDHCGVEISGGSSTAQSLEFSANSPTSVSSTNTKQINASLLFEPWYYKTLITPESLYSQVDLSTVDFGGDTIKQHFIDGKYDVSELAKYLIKDIFTNISVNNSFMIANESFIEIHATGQGNIYVLDNEDIELQQITVNTLSNEYKYYEVTLPNSTYKLTCDSGVSFDMALAIPTNVQIDYSVSAGKDILKAVSGTDERVLLELDYSVLSDPLGTGASSPANSNINIVGTTYLSAFNAAFSTNYDNYSMFYNIYPYKRTTGTTKTPVELRNNDVFNSIITLMATIHQDSDDSTYYSIFKDSTFGNDELIEVIKLVSIADNVGNNSAYKKLVNGLDSSSYKELIRAFNIDEVKINIAKIIYNLATSNSSLAKYIYAAYLGNDYVNKINVYTTTLMYSLLNSFDAPDDDPDLGTGGYQFITSNTTVDADKVTSLISYLSSSSNLNIDGYGIFALSSSQGIGFGIFIPDNLSLSEMDNGYYYDNSDLVYKVGNTDTASWRGGDSISSGVLGTVDYAFYHDMKQLVKSISTDVFELNIKAGSTTLNSVDDQIDNVNKVITYFLTSGLSSLMNATSITVEGYKLANNATLGSTTISLTGNNTTKTQGVSVIVVDAIVVYAEDTKVNSRYTLKFIAIDPSDLTLTADSSDSIPYSGGTVTLTLTGHGLPDGLDIEPYLSITSSGLPYSTTGGYWRLDPSYANNGIVKNDTAKIRIIIDSTLPGGEQAVDVKVTLSSSLVVTYTKVQNTGRDITSFGFVPFGDSNQDYSVGQTVPTTINSTIPYGRAYNYEELTDYTSENFYLYKFSISDNAKVVITATKELVENSVSESSAYGGLMKYTVTYTITPETNGAAKTYRHILTESQYFTDGAAYATIYADGNAVTTAASDEAYKALPASERPNYLYDGTLVYNYSDDMVTIAKFKSTETYYKISYSAKAVTSESFTTDGSLYTLSNGVYNKVTSGTFSSTTAYYERNYAVNNTVTLGNFTTDGSLFTLDGGKYLPVYNGTYSNSITYYSIVFEAASPAITAETFTSNGSLFTRSGEGTQNSPYVYTQVIDKRSLEDDMYASVAFNRTDEVGKSIEPQYRIKYSLSNFYTLGSNVVFGTTESTLGNLATTNITYAGLTVTVSENNDTGTYKFIYTYTNTGLWKDGEVYSRYYEFPEFIVEKHASTDALIHKLTFLEEAIVLGNTATVILPDTPLVPDKSGEHYGSDDQVYGTVFNATNRKIVVSSSGVRYTDNTDAVTISDYYAIGTVSDADLSYYCPTFEVNEFAEIYQYTTYKKLTSYGIGKQVETDSEVLSVHDNIYLYVPYEKNNEITILLVEVDESGYWRSVYTTDFAGSQYIQITNSSYNPSLSYYTRSGDVYSPETVTTSNFATLVNTGNLYYDCKVGEYPAHTISTKNAKRDGDLGTTGYNVSERAGEEADNSSLYMDYVGTPLDGHFWYVSYVVFSEDYISGGDTRGNVRYYHISIIDATNNVQFEVTVYADTTFNEADIYLTISENTYKKTNEVKNITGKRQISAFADDSSETYTGARASIAGFKIYKLKYDLQTLPGGFFYFYVDLPDGYVAEAYTDKSNNLSNSDVTNLKQNGAFDPATSIITVKIKLEIVIKKGTAQDSSAWAVNTTDIYTRQAEYKGNIPNN